MFIIKNLELNAIGYFGCNCFTRVNFNRCSGYGILIFPASNEQSYEYYMKSSSTLQKIHEHSILCFMINRDISSIAMKFDQSLIHVKNYCV